jgi:hypothetical protein
VKPQEAKAEGWGKRRRWGEEEVSLFLKPTQPEVEQAEVTLESEAAAEAEVAASAAKAKAGPSKGVSSSTRSPARFNSGPHHRCDE